MNPLQIISGGDMPFRSFQRLTMTYDLAAEYEKGLVPVCTLEEYVDLVIGCIALLPPNVIIHRISGDGPKKLLLAPLWSGNKKLVLGTLAKRLKERGICQGGRYLV